MVQIRSDRKQEVALASLATVSVFVGVAGMTLAAAGARSLGLGLPGAMIVAESALAITAVGAALLLRIPIPFNTGPRAPAGLFFAPVLAGAALWLTGLGLMGLQAHLWSPPPGYLDAFLDVHRSLLPVDAATALVSLTAIALAPAVCEELLFRGVALPAFVPGAGPVRAVLLSALLFGLIHVDVVGGALSLYRAPFAFAVGLGFGALRLRSGSLVPPIVAHATLNAATWSIGLFALDLDTVVSEAAPSAPGVAALELLLGGFAFTWLLRNWPGCLTDLGDSSPPSGPR
jgi:membrane protease YdiL (CAAX protease family)